MREASGGGELTISLRFMVCCEGLEKILVFPVEQLWSKGQELRKISEKVWRLSEDAKDHLLSESKDLF